MARSADQLRCGPDAAEGVEADRPSYADALDEVKPILELPPPAPMMVKTPTTPGAHHPRAGLTNITLN